MKRKISFFLLLLFLLLRTVCTANATDFDNVLDRLDNGETVEVALPSLQDVAGDTAGSEPVADTEFQQLEINVLSGALFFIGVLSGLLFGKILFDRVRVV